MTFGTPKINLGCNCFCYFLASISSARIKDNKSSMLEYESEECFTHCLLKSNDILLGNFKIIGINKISKLFDCIIKDLRLRIWTWMISNNFLNEVTSFVFKTGFKAKSAFIWEEMINFFLPNCSFNKFYSFKIIFIRQCKTRYCDVTRFFVNTLEGNSPFLYLTMIHYHESKF